PSGPCDYWRGGAGRHTQVSGDSPAFDYYRPAPRQRPSLSGSRRTWFQWGQLIQRRVGRDGGGQRRRDVRDQRHAKASTFDELGRAGMGRRPPAAEEPPAKRARKGGGVVSNLSRKSLPTGDWRTRQKKNSAWEAGWSWRRLAEGWS
ncbi:hypothetical protein MRX96_053579, partial [Rhipicephalus microplus]